MGATTPIEWCDSTVNPTSGCEGCELFSARRPEESTCYARRIHEQRLATYFRRSGHYAPSFGEVRMIAGRITEAARWSDLRGKPRPGKHWMDLLPRTIFVGDLSDTFSAAVTDEFLEAEVFAPIESERGRRHVWMLLTKRPSRLAEISERRGGLPDNVIAMTRVTDQATADARVPHLLRCRARWRGISAEPLLGPVTLRKHLEGGGIHWGIIGGESGPKARPCDVEAMLWLVEEFAAADVAPFVKQLGSNPVTRNANPMDFPGHVRKVELGELGDAVASAGYEMSDKKGGRMIDWPKALCVREMPALGMEVAA